MFEVHITRDGDQMLVFQMEDTHLINTILLKLRRMCECRALIKADFPAIDPMLQYAMPKGMNNENLRKKAAAEYRTQHETLMPYLLCALLRGLESGIKQQLNDAYGGNKGYIPNLKLPSLNAAKDNEDLGTIITIDDCDF